MEEGNLAILVDAKLEYTKQLVHILKGNIYKGIKRLYNDSKEFCIEHSEHDKVLSKFQFYLSEIPKWNQEVILTECSNIIESSKCDWLEELITAVFVSHTRILSSINMNRNKKKINLKIPKIDHFIHQCFIDAARSFWKVPYLLDDTIAKYEYQRNRRESETIIETSIEQTIRSQLPVKHILKEYLSSNLIEGNDSEIKELVKNEIEALQEPSLQLKDSKVTFDDELTEISNTDPVVSTVPEVVDEVVDEVAAEVASPVVAPVAAEVVAPVVAPVVAEVAAEVEEVAKVASDVASEVEEVAAKVAEVVAAPVAAPVAAEVVAEVAREAVVNNTSELVSNRPEMIIEDNQIDFNLDEVDINPKEINANIFKKEDTLNIEDLNLDYEIDNLNEVYLDKKDNVKTIVLDTNNLTDEDDNKKDVLKKYMRKRDYSFFNEN
jgi:hypothetical protein